MSRYDRRRERKRFLIIAAIVAVFAGSVYFFGNQINESFSTIDQASTKSG
jgi:hypothetical protein